MTQRDTMTRSGSREAVKNSPMSNSPMSMGAKKPRLGTAWISALTALLLLGLAVAGWVVFRSMEGPTSNAKYPATAPVTVTEATQEPDGVHVRARLDAPSTDGTSHELTGIIPTSVWKLSHTLWACYPPKSPKDGFLRTTLDPVCAVEAAAR